MPHPQPTPPPQWLDFIPEQYAPVAGSKRSFADFQYGQQGVDPDSQHFGGFYNVNAGLTVAQNNNNPFQTHHGQDMPYGPYATFDNNTFGVSPITPSPTELTSGRTASTDSTGMTPGFLSPLDHQVLFGLGGPPFLPQSHSRTHVVPEASPPSHLFSEGPCYSALSQPIHLDHNHNIDGTWNFDPMPPSFQCTESPNASRIDETVACLNEACDPEEVIPCSDPEHVPCPDPAACDLGYCFDQDCRKDPCRDQSCTRDSRRGSPCQSQGGFCTSQDCAATPCQGPALPTGSFLCFDENCPPTEQCNLPCGDEIAGCDDDSSETDADCRRPNLGTIDPTYLMKSAFFVMPQDRGYPSSKGGLRKLQRKPYPPRELPSQFNGDYGTVQNGVVHAGSDFGSQTLLSGASLLDGFDVDVFKDCHSAELHRSMSSATADDADLSCKWWCGDEPNRFMCGRAFACAQALHQHVEKAHIEGLQREHSQQGFYCHWQGCERYMARSFQARPKLKRHLQTHTLYKPFECPKCGVQMKTKDAMEKHERTHTGERPYVCAHAGCDKVFATSTELKTHTVVHSGQKPHKCPICHESFADSSNLSKHKKTHFLGMYKCPDCGARMKRWDQMRRHITTQKHATDLLEDRAAQLEYKARMEREFKEMPESQRVLGHRASASSASTGAMASASPEATSHDGDVLWSSP